jgi:cytochrome c553
MVHMVRHLSDAYLREIAGYFAQLDLPYPPVPTRTDASEQSLQHGKTLALQGDARRGIPACAQCHGEALTGVAPAIPSLLGLPRLYLASQLGDWLNNGRHALPPDCMAQVGRKLNSADINAVASWLAVQPVPANPKPAVALPGPLPMPCSAMGQ